MISINSTLTHTNLHATLLYLNPSSSVISPLNISDSTPPSPPDSFLYRNNIFFPSKFISSVYFASLQLCLAIYSNSVSQYFMPTPYFSRHFSYLQICAFVISYPIYDIFQQYIDIYNSIYNSAFAINLNTMIE